MDAILLLVSEFTEELIWAQVCLLSFWSAIYLYQYVIRRREVVQPELVPSVVVKDYLNRVRDGEQALRFQLFGEVSAGGAAPVVMSGGSDPGLLRELEAMRGRVASADSQIQEKDRVIAELRANAAKAGSGAGNSAELEAAKATWLNEKSELEKKLAAALSATPVASGGVPAEVTQQLEDLKARLQEYEVIEDDLANLKKYQLENKQLIEQLMGAGLTPNSTVSKAVGTGGAASVAAAAPVVAAAVVASAEPAPAAEVAPAPESAPSPAAPILTSVEGGAAPAASGEPAKAPGDKKEEDLLSEFEKMLAS